MPIQLFRLISIFMFCISLLFSQRVENSLLFHISIPVSEFNVEINLLDKYNTNNQDFNQFINKYNIINIQKWMPSASINDVSNGIHLDRVYRVVFDLKQHSIEHLKSELETLEIISSVEFEYKRKISYTPNDSQYNQQWFLPAINANDAWDLWDIDNGELPGNRDVILASVDLGVNWKHQDLRNNLWQNLGEDADGDGHTIELINGEWVLDPGDLNGIDDDNWDNNLSTFIDDLVGWDVSGDNYGDNEPKPLYNNGWSHGTHVAGLLSSTTNNNNGIASTAFNCSIMSIKCTGDNEDPSYITNGFEGVLYAAKAGYNSQNFSIINCSWGGIGYSIYEQETINLCHNSYKALIFAASGNGDTNGWGEVEEAQYPASYENVVSVTALGENNSWNHWATYHSSVDLASPGEGIRSTTINGYQAWSGTSMATPVAASVAGLLKAQNPSWTNDQILTMITATADPIIYSVNNENYLEGMLGKGRVDALNAVVTPLFPKIDLVGYDIYNQNDTDGEINIGESVDFTYILFNDPDWGTAIAPSASLSCNNSSINVTNSDIPLDNINPGDAGLNDINPITVQFPLSLEGGVYECDLSIFSNQNGYIGYNITFPVSFDVEDIYILLGDINADETIDVLDVVIAVNIVIEEYSPSDYEINAADMNQDGGVDVLDVILLINDILL